MPRLTLVSRSMRCVTAFCLITLTAGIVHSAPVSAELQFLQQQYPRLAALYDRYPNLHGTLAAYAERLSFTHPVETLATVVHELIHIDSASHRGFLIHGSYYEPYLNISAWPTINNRDIATLLTLSERTTLGSIYTSYLLNTPRNTLGNVLDEVNAYAQTLPFICRNAPDKASTHALALAGHLALTDRYLHYLLLRTPDQYRSLSQNTTSRGALETIVANAYDTLNTCFKNGVGAADPRPIPKDATHTFADQPKRLAR